MTRERGLVSGVVARAGVDGPQGIGAAFVGEDHTRQKEACPHMSPPVRSSRVNVELVEVLVARVLASARPETRGYRAEVT